MIGIGLLLGILVSFALARWSKSTVIWKFWWVNALLMLLYNSAGWFYIFKFLGEGGASLGPGLILLFGTVAHIIVLFIAIVVMAMVKASKDQNAQRF